MNIGIISSRYAKALMRFAEENGEAVETCQQARTIMKAFDEIPDLHRVIDDIASVSEEEKMALLQSALGEEKMTRSLEQFILLLFKNERIYLLRFMLRTYVDDFLSAYGIYLTKLVVPKENSALEMRLAGIIKRLSGKNVIMETEVRPEMVGGFIVRVGDYRVDASVKTQLDKLKRSFQKKNRRIV